MKKISWTSIRRKLAEELDNEEFTTWFEPLEVHSTDAKRLVLRAPNEHFVHTLEQGYRTAIDRCLQALEVKGRGSFHRRAER